MSEFDNILCHKSCEGCKKALSDNQCIKCKQGYEMNDGICKRKTEFIEGIYFEGKRVEKCSEKEAAFLNSEKDTCYKCEEGCIECSKAGICTLCDSPKFTFLSLTDNKCYQSGCPEGHFQVATQKVVKCFPCHRWCTSCTGPLASDCLSCRENLPLKFKQKEGCIEKCSEPGYVIKPPEKITILD